MLSSNKVLHIVGVGEVFDAIVDDLDGYGLKQDMVHCYKFLNVSLVSQMADEVLKKYSTKTDELFIAIDSHALNYARLELYGRARLLGFQLRSLVHQTAVISPSVKISDNVWVGPGCIIERNSHLAGNSFVGTGSKLGANVKLAAHVSLGAACRIGAEVKIASHTVLGENIVLMPNTVINRHVLIDQIGPWNGAVDAGTFLEADSPSPGRIVGLGYSYVRKM